MIESTDGKQVKYITALMEKSRTSMKEKAFAAEGLRLINEVDGSFLKKLYLSESFYNGLYIIEDKAADKRTDRETAIGYKADAEDEKLVRVRELLKKCDHEIMTDRVFAHVSGTVNSQGIMGVFRMPEYRMEDYIIKDDPLAAADKPESRKSRILLLDRIQDPGNLGTILRTAEAAGFDLIILNSGCVDIYNPKVVRSTMGAIYRMPFVYAGDLSETIGLLKENGYRVSGAYLESSVEYTAAVYPSKTGIVIGNEANGISREVIEACDERIRIPMCGKTESLNAAVAASLIMYEILRKDRLVSN